jgi:hypothetical protein
MVMVADLLPGLKRFVSAVPMKDAAAQMVIRVIVAFAMHSGRMSCLQAAGSIRTETRHRAQVGRMLLRPSFGRLDLTTALRRQLLALECGRGVFLLIIDATLASHVEGKAENTFSTGNRRRRPRKGRRYGTQKHTKKRCHSFTMGLLITPSGIRIPFSKPFYTREYCQRTGRVHRTTAESAADLVRELPLPDDAQVVVLGDTAYDADVLRAACADRGYDWIVPCNPERVLAGAKPRPKVRSLLKDWPQASRHTIRLSPGQGPYVPYRRLSPHRIGPKAKPRTYYVHQETRDVHSVGEVRLVFSTLIKDLEHATPDNVKILMTNNLRWKVREIIELYALRWQIEIFFKELKSTLGFHQYQFQRFECVERWSELALAAFMYLEWYRAQQLARRNLTDKEQQWWRHQRTHGLCQAVRQASQQSELRYLAHRLKTPGGIRKLKQLLRKSTCAEYRAAL